MIKLDPKIVYLLRKNGVVFRGRMMAMFISTWFAVATIASLWQWLTPAVWWKAAMIFFPPALMAVGLGVLLSGGYTALYYFIYKDKLGDFINQRLSGSEQLPDSDSDSVGGDGD